MRKQQKKQFIMAASLFLMVSYLVFVDNNKADKVIEIVIKVVDKIQHLA